MNKAIPIILALGLLPLFRAGPEKGITVYEWLWHHTIFSPRATIIPEEDYLETFEEFYGR